MESLKKLSAFGKRVKLSKQEKIEYGFIILTTLIITGIFAYTFMPVFAAPTTAEVAKSVKKILKVVCLVGGVLFTAVGIIKFAISHANEDGPAQQKAIMMMATGLFLVIIGVGIDSIVKDSWFNVTP